MATMSCCLRPNSCRSGSAKVGGGSGRRWAASVALAAFLLVPAPGGARAGERSAGFSRETAPAPGPGLESDLYRRGRWEFSLESVYTFTVVPNPFFAIAGRRQKNPLDYGLATQLVGVRYRLTNAGGPWLLRGSLQTSATLVGSAIVRGPESFFVGFALGFRYDFVQPAARLVPYVEFRGGPGVTDSRGFRHAQQQDFTFTYLIGAGLRYDLNARWSVQVGAVDQHLSNAYLTQPNYGFDSLGVGVGVFGRF